MKIFSNFGRFIFQKAGSGGSPAAAHDILT